MYSYPTFAVLPHSSCSALTFLCRLNIPPSMLPQTNNPTAFSVVHSENDTVLNVLVDMVIFFVCHWLSLI